MSKINEIKKIVEVIKTLKNINELYKLISTALNYVNKLDDKRLAVLLKEKFNEIQTSTEIDVIIKKCNELLSLLIENKKQQYKTFLGITEFDYTKEYKRARKKYKSLLNRIDEVEARIKFSTEFRKKLHEPIKHGKYKGFRHAYLTNNLRIIYYTNKKIVFFDIITKNELEKT